MLLDLAGVSISDLWLDVFEYLKLNPTSAAAIASTLVSLVAIRVYQSDRRRLRTPRLQGPPSQSFLFGVTKKLFPSAYNGFIYREWEQKYGPVYEIPASLGSRHIVLSDPKSIAHFFSVDTMTYHQPPGQTTMGRRVFGDLLIHMEGETHKRQRRVMSSAFSVSAIRNLTPMFFDTAYTLKAAWISSFMSSDNAGIIDVQEWMNFTALDTIGNAGFSHDFGTLKGKKSTVLDAFNSFGAVKPSLFLRLVMLIGPLFPKTVSELPNGRKDMLVELAANLKAIAIDFLNKERKDGENNDNGLDRSILGVMVKSESADAKVRLSPQEVIAQTMFMLAGYETIAITLTWALIELARHPEMQETLRAELRESFTTGETLTYDHLMSLPYLDAFVMELVRFHLPEPQTMRVANEDNVIPLTAPIQTASGTMIDSLFIEKGTVIRIPFQGVNVSEAMWGPDAGILDPNRWLVPEGAQKGRKEEVKGYRHLLSFGFGPRMCPARHFAVMELKAILSVLVHDFSFEFPDGPSTKLESHFVRPKLAGEDGLTVPLLVRRVI